MFNVTIINIKKSIFQIAIFISIIVILFIATKMIKKFSTNQILQIDLSEQLVKCLNSEIPAIATTNSRAENVIKEIGFRVRTSFIFDLPTTTKEDMQKTINFILETEPDEIRGHFLALRLGTTIYNKLAKEKEIPTQYIHSDKPLIENEKYTNSEMLQDIETLISKLKDKEYKIVKNVKEWENLESLRNKEGKIKFLSFCPSKYGIDWEK